jgi:fimbrial chaperone protein
MDAWKNVICLRLIPALFISLICISIAIASNIQINPTRLTLSREHPIAILSVKNENDAAELIMQLHAVQWTQQNQTDAFTPTQDILVTPPLFELKPQQTQIVRLAIQKPIESEIQKTYRVYLQEVIPEVAAVQPPFTDSLRIALNISVPIFIQPAKPNQQFLWHATWLDDNRLQLELRNIGNMTLFTDGWEILDQKAHSLSTKKMFQYVLPHQQVTWVVQPLKKTASLNIKAKINAEPTLSHAQTA